MKIDFRSTLKPAILFLLLAALVTPGFAQEEDDVDVDEGHLGDVFAELSLWIAQPSGLSYTPATLSDPTDPFGTQSLGFATGTDSNSRARAGFAFAKNFGSLVLTWTKHADAASRQILTPGDFNFGQTLTHPLYAGVRLDGMADGFNASSGTTLRDLRLDFYRTLIDTKRAKVDWFVGVRRVKHARELRAEYFAIVPNLPPIVPFPLILVPDSDTGSISSRYNGRGLEGGLEVRLPLYKEKLILEGGIAVAALRGKTDASYRSTTHYYFNSQTDEIFTPDQYATSLNDPGQFPSQTSFDIGLTDRGRSSNGHVEDVHVALRWKAWRTLEWFAGFRSTYYGNVGVDLRPQSTTTFTSTPSGGTALNLVDVSETSRSATYEGVFTGIYYQF